MDWEVRYYRTPLGREPVAEFVDLLSESDAAKVFRTIGLLAQKGVLLKEPYTRQMAGKMRELRVSCNRREVRILYFPFERRTLLLLHAFIKKTKKTPRREIEIGVGRMNDAINNQ